MFDILTQYLFEVKRLVLPQIGLFELENKDASADIAASTISAPSWVVGFKPYNEDMESNSNGELIQWLASKRQISIEEAGNNFDDFVADLQTRLDNGESINWPQLGVLEKTNEQIRFEPETTHISPFTNVAAKKIARENTSHQTLVGDRETTTAQMREQLMLPDEKRSSGPVVMWILLGVALIAAAWFFSQKGCHTSATGNQQKVESAKPGDTYKIR